MPLGDRFDVISEPLQPVNAVKNDCRGVRKIWQQGLKSQAIALCRSFGPLKLDIPGIVENSVRDFTGIVCPIR